MTLLLTIALAVTAPDAPPPALQAWNLPPPCMLLPKSRGL